MHLASSLVVVVCVGACLIGLLPSAARAGSTPCPTGWFDVPVSEVASEAGALGERVPLRRCGLIVRGRLTALDVDFYCRSLNGNARSMSIHSHDANVAVWTQAVKSGALRKDGDVMTLGGVAGYGELAWFDHTNPNYDAPLDVRYSITSPVTAANATGNINDDVPEAQCVGMQFNGAWTLLDCDSSRLPFACQITTYPLLPPPETPSPSPVDDNATATPAPPMTEPPLVTPAPAPPVTTATRPQVSDPMPPCMDDWIANPATGKCYRAFVGLSPASQLDQPQAELRCQTLGGWRSHLTSVLDADESAWLMATVINPAMAAAARPASNASASPLLFHIGARFMTNGAFGQWLEDSAWYPDYRGTSSPSWDAPPAFRNWATSQPATSFGCVAIDVSSGLWVGVDCLDPLPFVCSYINSDVQTPAPSETPIPIMTAAPIATPAPLTSAPSSPSERPLRCVDGWTLSPESPTCFFFTGRTASSSGYRVDEDCTVQQGFSTMSGITVRPSGAAVRTIGEAAFIAQSLIRNTTSAALLGASFVDSGAFGMFTDTTTEWNATLAAQLWAARNPTTNFGCIAITPEGRWVSVSCSSTVSGYVCQYDARQVPAGDSISRPTPPPPPPGPPTPVPPATPPPFSRRLRSLSGRTQFAVALGTTATYVLDSIDPNLPIPDGTQVIFSSSDDNSNAAERATRVCGTALHTKDITAVVDGQIAFLHHAVVDGGIICVSEDFGKTFVPIMVPSMSNSSALDNIIFTVVDSMVTGVIPLVSPPFEPPQRIDDPIKALDIQQGSVRIEERASGALQLVGVSPELINYVRLSSGSSCGNTKDALFTFGPPSIDVAYDVIGYELITVELYRMDVARTLNDFETRQSTSSFRLCVSVERPPSEVADVDGASVASDTSVIDILRPNKDDEVASGQQRRRERRSLFFTATDIFVHMPVPTVELRGIGVKNVPSATPRFGKAVTVGMFATPRLWLQGFGFKTGMSVLFSNNPRSCTEQTSIIDGDDSSTVSPASTIAPLSFINNDESSAAFVQLTANQTGMSITTLTQLRIADRIRETRQPFVIKMYMCLAVSTFTPYVATDLSIDIIFRTVDSINGVAGGTRIFAGFSGPLYLGGLLPLERDRDNSALTISSGLLSSLRIAFSTERSCTNPDAFFGHGAISAINMRPSDLDIANNNATSATFLDTPIQLVVVLPPRYVSTPATSRLHVCVSIGHSFDGANRRLFVPTAAVLDVRPVRVMVISSFAPASDAAFTNVELPINSVSLRDGLLLPVEGYGLGHGTNLILSKSPCLNAATYDRANRYIDTLQIVAKNEGTLPLNQPPQHLRVNDSGRYFVMITPSALAAIDARGSSGAWACIDAPMTKEGILPAPFRFLGVRPFVTDVTPQTLVFALDQDVAVSGFGLEGLRGSLIPAYDCANVDATRLWKKPLLLQYVRHYSSVLASRNEGRGDIDVASLGHHEMHPETHRGRWFLHVPARNMLSEPPGPLPPHLLNTTLSTARWCYADKGFAWMDTNRSYATLDLTVDGFVSPTDNRVVTRQLVLSQGLASSELSTTMGTFTVTVRGTVNILKTAYGVLVPRDDGDSNACDFTPKQIRELVAAKRMIVLKRGSGEIFPQAVRTIGAYDFCFAAELPLDESDGIAFTLAPLVSVIVIPAQAMLFSINSARNIVLAVGDLNSAGRLLPIDGLGLSGGALVVLQEGQECSDATAAPLVLASLDSDIAVESMSIIAMPPSAPRTIEGEQAPFFVRLTSSNVPYRARQSASYPICLVDADGGVHPTASHLLLTERAVTSISALGTTSSPSLQVKVLALPPPSAVTSDALGAVRITVRGVGLYPGEVVMLGDASCQEGTRVLLRSFAASDTASDADSRGEGRDALFFDLPFPFADGATFLGATGRINASIPLCLAASGFAQNINAPIAAFSLIVGASITVARPQITRMVLQPLEPVRRVDGVDGFLSPHVVQEAPLQIAALRRSSFTVSLTAHNLRSDSFLTLAPSGACGAAAATASATGPTSALLPVELLLTLQSDATVRVTAGAIEQVLAVYIVPPATVEATASLTLDVCATDDPAAASLASFWATGARLVLRLGKSDGVAPTRVVRISSLLPPVSGSTTGGNLKLPIDAELFAPPASLASSSVLTSGVAPSSFLQLTGIGLYEGLAVDLLRVDPMVTLSGQLTCESVSAGGTRQQLRASQRLFTFAVTQVDAAGTAARIALTAADSAKLATAGTFFMSCFQSRLTNSVALELRIPAASGTPTASTSSGTPQMPAAIVAVRTLSDPAREGDATLLAAGGSTLLTVPFGYTGRIGLTLAGRALNATVLRTPSLVRVAAIPTFYSCNDAPTIAPIAGRVMRATSSGSVSSLVTLDSARGLHASVGDLRLEVREADTLIQASQWRVCFSTDSGTTYSASPLSFSIAAIHAVNNKWALGRRSSTGELIYDATDRVLSFFGSNLDTVWPAPQQASPLQVAFDTQPCTDVGSTATQVGSTSATRVNARSPTVAVNPFTGLVRLGFPRLPAAAVNGATESFERVAEQQVELRLCLSIDGGLTYSEQNPRVWLSYGTVNNFDLAVPSSPQLYLTESDASIHTEVDPAVTDESAAAPTTSAPRIRVRGFGLATAASSTAYLLADCAPVPNVAGPTQYTSSASIAIDRNGYFDLPSWMLRGLLRTRGAAAVHVDVALCIARVDAGTFSADDSTATVGNQLWQAGTSSVRTLSGTLHILAAPASGYVASIAAPWTANVAPQTFANISLQFGDVVPYPVVLSHTQAPIVSLVLASTTTGKRTVLPVTSEGLAMIAPVLPLGETHQLLAQLGSSGVLIPLTPSSASNADPAMAATFTMTRVVPVASRLSPDKILPSDGVKLRVSGVGLAEGMRLTIRDSATSSAVGSATLVRLPATGTQSPLGFFFGPDLSSRPVGTTLLFALDATLVTAPNSRVAPLRLEIVDKVPPSPDDPPPTLFDETNERIADILDAAADADVIAVAQNSVGHLAVLPADVGSLPVGSLITMASRCEAVATNTIGSNETILPTMYVMNGRFVSLVAEHTRVSAQLWVCVRPTDSRGAFTQLQFTQLRNPATGNPFRFVVSTITAALRLDRPHFAVMHDHAAVIDTSIADPEWRRLHPGYENRLPVTAIAAVMRLAIGTPCHTLSAPAPGTPAALRLSAQPDPNSPFNAFMFISGRSDIPVTIGSQSVCVSVNGGRHFTSLAVAVHRVRRTPSLMTVSNPAALASGSSSTFSYDSTIPMFSALGTATPVTDINVRDHFSTWSSLYLQEDRQQLMLVSRAVESFLWQGHVGLDGYIRSGVLYLPPWSLPGGNVTSLTQDHDAQQLFHSGDRGVDVVATGISVYRQLPELSCLAGRQRLTLHRGEPGRIVSIDAAYARSSSCSVGIVPGTILRVGCNVTSGSSVADIMVGEDNTLIVPRQLSYMSDVEGSAVTLPICIKVFSPHMIDTLGAGQAAAADVLAEAEYIATNVGVAVAHDTFIEAIDGQDVGTLLLYQGEGATPPLRLDGSGIGTRSIIVAFAPEADLGQTPAGLCRAIAARRLKSAVAGTAAPSSHPLLDAWLPAYNRTLVIPAECTAEIVTRAAVRRYTVVPSDGEGSRNDTEDDDGGVFVERLQVCVSSDGGASFEPIDDLFITVVPPTVVGYALKEHWTRSALSADSDTAYEAGVVNGTELRYGSDGLVRIGGGQPTLRIVANDFAASRVNKATTRFRSAAASSADFNGTTSVTTFTDIAYFDSATTRFAVRGVLPRGVGLLHVALIRDVAACSGEKELLEKALFRFVIRPVVSDASGLYEVVPDWDNVSSAAGIRAFAEQVWDPIMADLRETTTGLLCASVDGKRFFSPNAIGPFVDKRLATLQRMPFASIYDKLAESLGLGSVAQVAAARSDATSGSASASSAPWTTSLTSRRFDPRSSSAAVTSRIDALRGGTRRLEDTRLVVTVGIRVDRAPLSAIMASNMPTDDEALQALLAPTEVNNARLTAQLRDLLVDSLSVDSVNVFARLGRVERVAAAVSDNELYGRVSGSPSSGVTNATASPYGAGISSAAAAPGSNVSTVEYDIVPIIISVRGATDRKCEKIYAAKQESDSHGVEDLNAESLAIRKALFALYDLLDDTQTSEERLERAPTGTGGYLVTTESPTSNSASDTPDQASSPTATDSFLDYTSKQTVATTPQTALERLVFGFVAAAAANNGTVLNRTCNRNSTAAILPLACRVRLAPVMLEATLSGGVRLSAAVARTLTATVAEYRVAHLLALRRNLLLPPGEGGSEFEPAWRYPQCPLISPAQLPAKAIVHGELHTILSTEMADKRSTLSSIPVLLLVPFAMILLTWRVWRKHFDFKRKEKMLRQAIRERLRSATTEVIIHEAHYDEDDGHF